MSPHILLPALTGQRHTRIVRCHRGSPLRPVTLSTCRAAASAWILSVLNAAADHHPRELLVVGIATFDQKRPAVGVDEHDPGGAATPAVVINYESRSSAGGTIGHSTTSQVACCLYQQPKRPALRPTKAAATTAATTWIERVQNRRGRHSALV